MISVTVYNFRDENDMKFLNFVGNNDVNLKQIVRNTVKFTVT